MIVPPRLGMGSNLATAEQSFDNDSGNINSRNEFYSSIEEIKVNNDKREFFKSISHDNCSLESDEPEPSPFIDMVGRDFKEGGEPEVDNYLNEDLEQQTPTQEVVQPVKQPLKHQLSHDRLVQLARQGRERIRLEAEAPLHPRFKTLFYGLQPN